MYDYKLEEEKKKYQGYIAHYEELLHLLENIKYTTKKDGTPYQSLVKNIDLSDVKLDHLTVHCRDKYYSSRGEKELHFTWYDKNSKYQEYNIDLQTRFDIENIDPSRIIKIDYIMPFYNLELDDLKKYIENQKKIVKGWMQADIELLNNIDAAWEMAKKFEEEFKKKYPNISMWYFIKECF